MKNVFFLKSEKNINTCCRTLVLACPSICVRVYVSVPRQNTSNVYSFVCCCNDCMLFFYLAMFTNRISGPGNKFGRVRPSVYTLNFKPPDLCPRLFAHLWAMTIACKKRKMKVMAQGEWYVEANAVIIKKSTMTTYYNKAIMHCRARTPSKMDSSSLGACRRRGPDATNARQRGRYPA